MLTQTSNRGGVAETEETAVAAVTTAGYAGVLLGPAAVGFIAREAGLAKAFWVLAGLLGVVVAAARAATARTAVRTNAILVM